MQDYSYIAPSVDWGGASFPDYAGYLQGWDDYSDPSDIVDQPGLYGGNYVPPTPTDLGSNNPWTAPLLSNSAGSDVIGFGPTAPGSSSGLGALTNTGSGYGSDLGGIGSSTVGSVGSPGSSIGGVAAWGSLFGGLANAISGSVRAAQGPQALQPGTYYNPQTGKYQTVSAVPTTALSPTLLLIAAAAVVLILATR